MRAWTGLQHQNTHKCCRSHRPNQEHNQRWFTNYNERTNTLFYKNISLTFYSRCFWEMGGEIYRERTSSSHIFFQEPVDTNACIPFQTRQRRLWSAACPTLDCDSLHAVQIWSHGYHVVPFSVTHLFDPNVLTRCHFVYLSKCDSLPKHTGSLGTNRKSITYVI